MMSDQFPVLENGNELLARVFSKMGKPVIFSKGSVFLEAGEYVTGIYYVVRGKVDCYVISIDGRKKSVLIEGPGCTLSDMPVIDGGPQPVYYRALEEVYAIFIEKSELEVAFREYPELKETIVLSVCKKCRALSDQLMQMCFDDAEIRVCNILLKFAYHYGKKIDSDKCILINFDLSQQFISDLVGVNRTTTTRVVYNLKHNGLLKISEGKYIITDIFKLKELISPNYTHEGTGNYQRMEATSEHC